MVRQRGSHHKIAALLAVLLAALLLALPHATAAAGNSSSGRATPHMARAVNAAPLFASCYGSATTVTRSVAANTWTGWYSRTATANCADLNVAVTNHPSSCYVFVDAQYYSRSQGRWIDGAADDFWMVPGYWYEPLTALRDGTSLRVRFYTQCSDSSATFWFAS